MATVEDGTYTQGYPELERRATLAQILGLGLGEICTFSFPRVFKATEKPSVFLVDFIALERLVIDVQT